MKIYVDEMPNNCWECPCFQNNIECSCGLDDGTKDYFLDAIDGGECPLINITEHDAELMKNAIVPKFNSKQFVYALYTDTDIIRGQIESFDYYSKSYLIFFGDDVGSDWIPEFLVFKTKKEAELKLKEL